MIHPGLDARLRGLLEAMDTDVALALSDLGARDYRTRYSAVVRYVDDARQRLVRLTAKARRMLPAINAEWDATEAAAAALDAELPYSLSALIDDLAAALERRRFRDRIADAAADLPASEERETLMRSG
jgi:DNA-binding MarR family transcriptional regulator